MDIFQKYLDQIMAEPSHWHWWALSLFLLIIELLAPGVIFLWVGISAMITGIIVFLFPSFDQTLLCSLFAILSVVTAVIGRHYLKPKYDDEQDHPTLSRRADNFIGKSFVVAQNIENGFGKIKIGDSLWKAAGKDAKEGQLVKVISIDGATLNVEPEIEK